MNSPKAILITGGLGFIGFNLTKKLSQYFEKIYIVDSLISDTKNSLNENSSNIEVHNIDINNISNNNLISLMSNILL